jgi:hypothetical protein
MTPEPTIGSTSEVTWIRSSYSDSSNSSECVEIAATSAAVHVRDSKNPRGPRLAVKTGAWAEFLACPVCE